MKKVNLFFVYSAVISAVFVFSKCTLNEDIAKIAESLDSLQILVGTPNFKTGVHIEFVDAKTGELIADEDVSVSISGRDAAIVYNNIGSKQASYSSYWGMLDLIIDPHKVDTIKMATDPIQFDVDVSLNGYVSESHSISIYDASTQKVTIPLINVANPPQGVSFIESEVSANTAADGGLTDEIVVDFNAPRLNSLRHSKNLSSQVSIAPRLIFPKGIILLNSGDNIKSITVTARISDFPADGIPKDKRLGKYSSNIFMLKYGSVSYNIKAKLANGSVREVSRTRNGVLEMNVDIPENYINNETMKPFKEKDKVSRLMILGSFKKEIDEVKKIDGKLVLVGKLSDYTYSTQIWGKIIPACSETSKNRIVFNFDQDNIRIRNQRGTLDYSFYTSKDNYFIFRGSTPWGGWGMITQDINGFLPEGGAKVTFNSNNMLKFTPDTLIINSLCEMKTYNVGVESNLASSNQKWITLNLDLKLVSKSNKNLVIKPSIKVYLRLKENSAGTDVFFVNGKASCLVMENVDYVLLASFGNTRARGSLKIENDSPTTFKVSFTPQLSYNSVGVAQTITVPKTSENELTLNYQFEISDEVLNQLK